MKIKSRNFLITSLTILVMMVAILFSAVEISPLTAYAAERADREIVAVYSGNELNMCITDDGMLKWDAVDGATGYKVYLKKGSYTVATFDSISTSMFIASEIDQTKADSGQYLLEVAAVGASKSASMQYYYTSNVDKLEAPTKLQWLGNNAVWEYVDDAEVLVVHQLPRKAYRSDGRDHRQEIRRLEYRGKPQLLIQQICDDHGDAGRNRHDQNHIFECVADGLRKLGVAQNRLIIGRPPLIEAAGQVAVSLFEGHQHDVNHGIERKDGDTD